MQFITDNKGGIFRQKNNSALSRKTVLKSNEVVVNNYKKIEPRENQTEAVHEGSVHPIVEGGEMIGFVYECSCGEVAKIMFDLAAGAKRAAG
jgi:hypothetical protein